VRLQFTVGLYVFRFRRGVVIIVVVVCVFHSVRYFVPTLRRSLLPQYSG
jgi:hypothetical protein